MFVSFLVYVAAHQLQQPFHIRLSRLEIVAVAPVQVKVALTEQPPQRVGAYAVHPRRQRGIGLRKVERPLHGVVMSENRQYGHQFRVQIAHPYEAVALDSVPNILLHTLLNGIGAGVPDVDEHRVVAHKRAQPRRVLIARDGPYRPQIVANSRILHFDIGKAETRVARLRGAEPWHRQYEIAHGVVVCRPALPAIGR